MNFDHLVIAADNLEQGREWVQRQLGIDMSFGGDHIQMGTHNLLVQLDDQSFLEVIAVNSLIPAPNRPRWFDLDNPLLKRSIKSEPRLLTWLVNTDNIDSGIQNGACSFGRKVPISRNNLNWDISLPSDGRLFGGGLIPYLIQWHNDEHPAKQMVNLGINLIAINIYHPYPDWLSSVLESINATNLVNVHPVEDGLDARLTAVFNTPLGIRKI